MKSRRLSVLLAILLSIGGASCTPQASPSVTPTSELVEITVYFTDRDRYARGMPPFERPVTRLVDRSSNMLEAVIVAFFAGPTEEEREQGLELVASGFIGFASLTIEGGIARIFLTGECRSGGATYTVAQPIMRNLLQFPHIRYVKIYDQAGHTEEPAAMGNSIPFCLEP